MWHAWQYFWQFCLGSSNTCWFTVHIAVLWASSGTNSLKTTKPSRKDLKTGVWGKFYSAFACMWTLCWSRPSMGLTQAKDVYPGCQYADFVVLPPVRGKSHWKSSRWFLPFFVFYRSIAVSCELSLHPKMRTYKTEYATNALALGH